MNAGTAELTSIANSIEELTTRLSNIAEHLSAHGNIDLSTELFEVERSLLAATRRMNKALRSATSHA